RSRKSRMRLRRLDGPDHEGADDAPVHFGDEVADICRSEIRADELPDLLPCVTPTAGEDRRRTVMVGEERRERDERVKVVRRRLTDVDAADRFHASAGEPDDAM